MVKPKRVWLLLPLLIVAQSQRHADLLGQGAPSPSVSLWRSSEVFARGPLLLDRMDESHYQVYAVRRDKPGAVELHALDTDIIFVLDGAATFVTGGSVVEPRERGANEMSGTGIRDGERRQIAKGDVMIVPNGTPHWFQDTKPTISYFAVKVRQANRIPVPSGVLYWKGSEVFDKGGLLFDAKEGRYTRVYAIRRDKPLGVELHALDTDVVFVVDGSGTFVTDGSIVEARSIGPTESTGTGIEDGNPRPIGRGDVLVMPKGTPHWLRDVGGPIDFFAVKVR